jgi:hypothetical protein
MPYDILPWKATQGADSSRRSFSVCYFAFFTAYLQVRVTYFQHDMDVDLQV